MTMTQTLNPDGDIPGTVRPTESPTHNIKSMAKALEGGSTSQKTLVLFEMPQLLENCAHETLEILVPAICLFVNKWDEDLQIAAAEALLDVAQAFAPTKTKGIIIQAALQVINHSVSEDLLESWGEILVIILPTMKLESANNIMSIIYMIDTFATSELSICRKLASRVLGAISSTIPSEKVEAHILKHVLRLVEDPDPEIRGMTAESMAFVGAVISEEATSTQIWPKIMSLLDDKDARIRAVTLRTTASIIAGQRERNCDVTKLSQQVYPVLINQASFAHRTSQLDQRVIDTEQFLMLEMVSEVFGQLLYSCFAFLEDKSEKERLVNTFYAMANCNSPTVRRACAFNLPGICVTLELQHVEKLASIGKALSTDIDVECRSNLAAGIHETVRALICPQTVEDLLDTVTALLRDENPVVRMRTLQNFFSVLSALLSELKGNLSTLKPLFESLTCLNEGNWRSQDILAKQLQDGACIIPYSALRQYVLPLFYQLAEDSTSVVRKSVMAGIAKVLWYIPMPLERENEMRTFRIEWGEGGVYWMRMAFIDSAEAAMQWYSKKLFTSLFLDTLLYLTDDFVPNVRLRLAKLIPKLVQFCDNSPALNMAISVFKRDPDRDVRDAMQDIDEIIATAEDKRISLDNVSKLREEAEAEMVVMAEEAAAEAEEANISCLPVSCLSPTSIGTHVNVIEACTPTAASGEENVNTESTKNMDAKFVEDESAQIGDMGADENHPSSPRRGLKSLRLHFVPSNSAEKQNSARNISLPKIVLSPINSPEASASESVSPRRKGIQILRDLGWTRKRADRSA